MKPMETLQDLIEEAKIRMVWWALCIFAISYFLTHTSKSMWMNLPISILLLCGFRILFNEVEFRWKVRNVHPRTYLSYLEHRKLSVNDIRLYNSPPPPRWKRKVDSPLVEAAMEEFIDKILKDFVVDLWYSEITPDKEAPDLIRAIVMDVLGEISGRVKDLNLVELLSRDIVNLIGDHLDLFRRVQASIGVDVMKTLSSTERDDRLKFHLMSSKELHPALISPECEYKILRHLMSGLLATALRPQESQCPLVRCIARELLTCLVMQPLMNMASPVYVNELIEYILLSKQGKKVKDEGNDQSFGSGGLHGDQTVVADVQHHELVPSKIATLPSKGNDIPKRDGQTELLSYAYGPSTNTIHGDPSNLRPADWAKILNAATQRRTEVLMPENLENMWTKGRHYNKKKIHKNYYAEPWTPVANDLRKCAIPKIDLGKEISVSQDKYFSSIEHKSPINLPGLPHLDIRVSEQCTSGTRSSQGSVKGISLTEGCQVDKLDDSASLVASKDKSRLKRSSSASALKIQSKVEYTPTSKDEAPIISEFYGTDFVRTKDVHHVKSASDVVSRGDRLHDPKLKCRVLGAYFEKVGTKSFAVYSIAVTDANMNTYFVKRRYSNFERLHRCLKDIPNYTLHLPPKRIFSSSTEDAFVRQRCIQLDKYLQDLLSIANVAEQHEVWDFLSASSENYSCGKSSSVMRALAVNVDDAMDDIIRQFKGTFDGFMQKDAGLPSSSNELTPPGRNLSWSVDDINKRVLEQNIAEPSKSFSDNEEEDKDGTQRNKSGETSNGWHSDNEINFRSFSPRMVKYSEGRGSHSERKRRELEHELIALAGHPMENFRAAPDHLVDPIGVPLKWDPPRLSVPMLNLVDKIFQLKRRGWLRRQVFWISKQILQLMMEDAIDDWLLREIQLLRRDDIIAQEIRWIQDVLWPDGKFFIKIDNRSEVDASSDYKSPHASSHLENSKWFKDGSFEQQLEAARRANDVKKFIFDGAPATLVGLIGHKQYRRCARDIYYFLQSTVCLKQLAYGILELLLVSVFPELQDVVSDVHDKMHVQPT